MDRIRLAEVSPAYAEEIAEYRAEFPAERMQVTCDPERIPGLDHLEEFASVPDWLAFCESMKGKITWYLAVRERDGKIVGAAVLRHSLRYDDDDPDFASHIGYSVRPSEQGRGYAKEQLRLILQRAKALGLSRVRLVCRDINVGSRRVILANGGVLADTIHGEESGMNIQRYDIRL